MTELYRVRKMSVEMAAGGVYIKTRVKKMNSFLAVTSHFLHVAHIVKPFLNTFPFTSFRKYFLGSYSGKLTEL